MEVIDGLLGKTPSRVLLARSLVDGGGLTTEHGIGVGVVGETGLDGPATISGVLGAILSAQFAPTLFDDLSDLVDLSSATELAECLDDEDLQFSEARVFLVLLDNLIGREVRFEGFPETTAETSGRHHGRVFEVLVLLWCLLGLDLLL